MRKIEKIEKYQRTSKDTLNKNREKGMIESMLKNKSEQGITLVALVITVIIIIILATVAINFAFGNNGLITRAEQARDFYANDTKYTEQSMTNVESYLAELMPEEGGDGGDEPITPPAPPVPEEWDTSVVTPVLADENIYVPVPKGFTASKAEGETSINEGFVIYQGTEEVNNENVDTAKTTRNQFVWIPVSSSEVNEMYEVVEEGISLSAYSGVDAKTNVYGTATGGAPGSTSYREPDILVSTSYGDASTNSSRGIALIKSALGSKLGLTGSESNTQVIQKFADMIVTDYTASYNSIVRYGGFYIGRYELTGTVGSPTVQKDQAVLTNQNWYQLYKACGDVISSSSATSTMINGTQWDRTLEWLVDVNTKTEGTAGKTETEVYSNSSSWGNYEVDGVDGTKQAAGSNPAWQANNIYDLAGNCYEWTQEAHDTSNRVFRGGFYNISGSGFPASFRQRHLYLPFRQQHLCQSSFIYK